MIRVVVDDLGFVQADAVLRPANDVLDPISHAVSRMDIQGGNAFAQQRKTRSPLDIGAAVVTGGGELSAKLVIHLVLQTADTPVTRNSVRRALVSAWQRAGDWKLAAIAAPVVGSGAGQLSLDEAVRLLRDTFLERPMIESPTELVIVVEDEAERERVQAVIESPPS